MLIKPIAIRCRVLAAALIIVPLAFATSQAIAQATLQKDAVIVAGPSWKAGVASVVITPEHSMWMAGYAARNKPSEGTAQDLFAKALAIEDAGGTKLVIVTTDLIGIPRTLRDSLTAKVQEQFGLAPEALLLNASHTHCGPELRATKAALLDLGEGRVSQAREYLAGLETKLVTLIGQALDRRAPARLGYTHARCGFAMNRRSLTERGYIIGPNPDGPVDHSVPVLRVESAAGPLQAVLFGYACHNTTLSFYQFCGDYAGYAQQFLEEAHPGAAALFLTGCGGDQNPYPRRTLEHARQHGRSLANAVEAALEAKPRPVDGPLRLALEEVVLQFAPPPSREELLVQKESTDRYDRRHAERLLAELDETGRIRDEYPYLVQAVRFGDALLLVALAGEVVVDYSLRLKRELTQPGSPEASAPSNPPDAAAADAPGRADAPDPPAAAGPTRAIREVTRTPGASESPPRDAPAVWIAGYSNDVFGYVPSRRVLAEGGYEAGGAMRHTPFPGPFAPTVEERIIGKVHELTGRFEEPDPLPEP